MSDPSAASLRRVLVLVMLVVAGIASLATEPGAQAAAADATGTTSVGPDGTQLNLRLHIAGLSTQSSSPIDPSTLDFRVLGDPTQATVEGDGTTSQGGVLHQVISIDHCGTACAMGLPLTVRLARPDAAPANVPWSMHVVVYGAQSLDVSVDGAADVNQQVYLGAVGVLIGLGAALLGFGLLSLRLRRTYSRLAVLEFATMLILGVTGLFVAAGAFVNLATATAGVAAITGAAVIAVGAAVTRAWWSRPTDWVVPVAGLSLVVVLSRLSAAGAYRELDVVVAMIGVGFASCVACLEFGAILRRMTSRLEQRNGVLLVGVASLVVVVAVSSIFAVASVSVHDSAGLIVALPFFVLIFFALLAGWRWFRGDSLTAFVSGIVIVAAGSLIALLTGVGTLLSGSFAGSGDWGVPILALPIPIAGLVFTILAMNPPVLRDRSVAARSFQTRWEQPS